MKLSTRLLILVLPVSIGVAAYSTAQAQAPGVDVSLTTETSGLTVGDPVTLDLRAIHPPGYQVTFPQLPGTWGEFELRAQSPAETVLNLDGTQTTSQSLQVTLFATGDFTTPDVDITVRDSAGQLYEQTVGGASLTVTSVLKEGDEELRDIRPQASVGVPATWPWVLGAVAIAALVAAGAYLLMRRRGDRGQGELIPADIRAPHQIALEELYRIEALDLPAQRQFKEHYTLVADCIRDYLERAFHTAALDRTTSEVRGALKTSEMAPDHADITVRLLEDSDLVKFTKLAPDTEEAASSTIRARDLVMMTVPPQPQEPALPEGAGA